MAAQNYIKQYNITAEVSNYDIAKFTLYKCDNYQSAVIKRHYGQMAKTTIHCVPIKKSTFFMNNSVKSQVIGVILVHRMLNNFYISDVACSPQLKATIYLVKGRSYASDQISIAFLKNWMHLK